MGKALAITGLVLLLLVGSCVGCMYVAWKKTTGLQDDFYAAVATGDVDQLMSGFHPSLKEEVDRGILEAWMKAMNARLGRFQELALDDINFSMNSTPEGERVSSTGMAVFENGRAKSKVETLDGKVVAFDVDTGPLGKDWFVELADRSGPEKHAQAFLQAIRAEAYDNAWDMMHEALRADVGEDKWQGMAGTIKTLLGDGDLTQVRAEFVGGEKPLLALWYEAGGPGQVKLEYRPQQMKFQLTAFNAK